MSEIQWIGQAAFAAIVTEGERKLAVIVQPDLSAGWNVMSVETSKGVDSAEELFDDHAHKIIGKYKSVPKAFEAAESFVRAWRKGFKSTKHEQCECSEMVTDEKVYCVCGIDDAPSKPDPRLAWRHMSHCPHSKVAP